MRTKEELLADVGAAQAARDAAAARWEAYAGNNPYPPALKAYEAASGSLESAIEAVKAAGAMPRTEAELLNLELDKAFPDAKSNEVVMHQGRRYKRKFAPTGNKSRPWHRYWQALGD